MQMMALFLLAAAAAPAPVAVERAALDRPASTMTNAEIKAYNEGLAPTDAAYIKCRKIEEIGSLMKKARVCHTNDEWKALWVQGNRDSRDTMDAYASKAGDCRATGTC